MVEKFENMNMKDVILGIWKNKISFPFNYKDLEELEEMIDYYEGENQELKKQLERKYEKVGMLTAEILYEENTRFVNEITVLKTENQKLKEMQCTFQGTGCQNKMKKYKEVIEEFMNYIEDNKLVLNNPAIFDFYLKIKEVK